MRIFCRSSLHAVVQRDERCVPWSEILSAITAIGQEAPPVDTALVVSVDISNSVDDARYRLQMGGIAKALEDRGVIEAITGGSGGGILFSMVTWADTPSFVIPWVRIANKADSFAVAKRVRSLWRQGGEFTCMTRMLRSVNDKIVPQIPMGRLGKPDEIAGLVAYLSSEEAAFVTGANIAINGGQHMF
jgi:hypothetical protein